MRGRQSPLLSFQQLLQRVQASESELRAELAARGAFSWNSGSRRRGGGGRGARGGGGEAVEEREAKRSKASAPSAFPPAVRVLEPSFEASMLDYLLLTAAGSGWRPHAIPTEDLVRAMVSARGGGGFGEGVGGEEGGPGGGGYDEGVLRHALWRWSARRRAEGGGSGTRASDDGGVGGGASPCSAGEGTAPTPASQGKSPSSSSAAAAAAASLFDEDLHEASAEAFSGRGGEDAGDGEGQQRQRQQQRGAAAKRPPLPPLLSLDAATVLRHEARKLLRDSPAWPEAAFSAAWREALERLGVDSTAAAAGQGMPAGPSSLSLDLAAATSGGGALAGLATLLPPQQRNQTERIVVRLDASALPRDPRSRFAALFAAKARWRKEEIAPYLAGAAVAPGTPGGTSALLLAHARASQSEPDAPVFFSAR